MTPARHRAMVATQEHRRDFFSLKETWTRVVRIFEQAVLEALLFAGGLLAHHPRKKPHTGVDERQGGDLAP